MDVKEENYLDSVPELTKEFVTNVCQRLEYIEKEEENIYVGSKCLTNKSEEIFFVLLSELFNLDEKYLNIYYKCKFDFDYEEIIDGYYFALISKYGDIIGLYKNEYEYGIITPVGIVLEYIEKMNKDVLSVCVSDMNGNSNVEFFIQELSAFYNREINSIVSKKTMEYFSGIKSYTASYLETLGKMYQYLDSILDSSKMSNVKEQLMALSSILSVYYYKDTSAKFNTKEELIKVFSELKLTEQTLKKINSALNITGDILEKYSPVLVLETYFSNYSSENDVEPEDIIIDLFEDSNTSFALNKILTNCNVDPEILLEKIKEISLKKHSSPDITRDTLFEDCSANTISYFLNSCKIYQYLLEIYKTKEIDGLIMRKKDDFVAFSMMINAILTEDYMGKFFTEKGINITFLEELFDIKINQEEIEKIEVDDAILIDKFSEYIEDDDNTPYLTHTDLTGKIIHRIYFEKNGENIPDNFNDFVNQFYEEKKQKYYNDLEEELFKDIDINVFKFLRIASIIYEQIKENNLNFSGKNMQTVSLIIAVFYEKSLTNSPLIYYLKSIGLNGTQHIENYIGLSNLYLNGTSSRSWLDTLNNHFKEFIFEGVNSNIERKDITIENIVENAFNKELNDSYKIVKMLDYINIRQDAFENLSYKIKQSEQIRKLENAQTKIEYLKSKNPVIYKLFLDATKIRVALENTNYDTHKINSSYNLNVLSMLIAILKANCLQTKIFERNGITLEFIYNVSEINENEFKERLETSLADLSDVVVTCKIVDAFDKWIDSLKNNRLGADSKHLGKIDIGNVARRVVQENSFLTPLVSDWNKMRSDIFNDNLREEELSREEKLLIIKREKPTNIDITDITTIISYDSILSAHSKMIRDDFESLAKSSEGEDFSSIDELLYKIYDTKESTDTDKKSLISKLFKKTKTSERKINPDVLNKICEKIDSNINSIVEQIESCKIVREFIREYLNERKMYIEVLKKAIKVANESLEKIDKSDVFAVSEFETMKQALENRLNSIEMANSIMTPYYIKINQMLLNHFIAIDSLNLSKDVILPLIGSEIVMSVGVITDKDSIDLSNNLINLFHTILENNIDETRKTFDEIKSSAIPEEVVKKIEAGLNSYLNQVSDTPLIKASDNNPKVKKMGKKES